MSRGGLNSSKSVPQPNALRRWPPAPSRFSEGERAAWSDLGRSLLDLGTVAKPDLLLVQITARTLARLDASFDDPEVNVTAVNALSRLAADLLNRLGLSPQARGTVSALPKKQKKDELSDFE